MYSFKDISVFEVFGIFYTTIGVQKFLLSHLTLFFDVSIFITGETGIGKSTLIDTLFNTNLKDKKSSHFYSNIELKIQTYELQESNVQLKLTVVKTVGYGDQINKEARLVFSYFN